MVLQEYKHTNEVLTAETDALRGDSSSLGHGRTQEALLSENEDVRREKISAQQALESAQSTSQSHLDNIKSLEQTLFDLGGEIGAGRHVPPGVRVLSLRDNSEQQWVDLRQAVMDRLRSENEALMRRLKELEESGVRVAGMEGSRAEGELGVGEQGKEPEDVVKQKEKRMLRLQRVSFYYLFS